MTKFSEGYICQEAHIIGSMAGDDVVEGKCRASMRVSVPGERSASWSRGGEGADTGWALCLGLHLC